MNTLASRKVEYGHFRFLVLLVVFILVGCSSQKEKALQSIEKLGISADKSSVHKAAINGDTGLLELLHTAGVEVDKVPFGEGETPLISAITQQNNAVPFLFSHTRTQLIDSRDAAGRSALSHAVAMGLASLALGLLDKSADPTATAHPNSSVMTEAVNLGLNDVVAKMATRCSENSPLLADGVVAALKTKNAIALESLLASNASPHLHMSTGESYLHYAAAAGDTAGVRLLTESGAKHTDGTTDPLLFAVENDALEMAERLLAAGCKPDAVHEQAGTPIARAVALNRLHISELFLKTGSPAQIHLASALEKQNFAMVDLLIKYGADIHTADEKGDTPLILAVLNRAEPTVKFLLGHKAALDPLGRVGQNALALSVAMQETGIVEALLEAGCNANEVFKAPPKPEFLDRITDNYFKGWLQKDSNLSPLMCAASSNNLPLLRLLMRHGAKRGAQTKAWRRYAVNFACDQSHIPAAQLLLGRDPDEGRDVKIVVSLSKQRADIYQEGKVIRSTSISSGRRGFATPSGQFVISDKQAYWMSTIYKCPMPFFMRLSCRDFGLHAGVVTGSPASHGCIRLPKNQAQAFFAVMKIGDPVTISY